MSTEIWVAALGVVGTLGGSGITYARTSRKYKSKIDELERKRFHERELSFERAQFGYRKLYEKLMTHYDAVESSSEGLDDLYADYNEIQGVGFRPVCTAVDQFWPEDRRIARKPPLQDKIGPLREAMHLHGTIKLRDLDEMVDRGEA
jgi:hypothetical protein